MDAISCDRCGKYDMDWKRLQIHNKTDNTWLSARDRKGVWVDTQKDRYNSKPEKYRTHVDLCIPCFKNVEMAIADNVGQVFYEEIITKEATN